MTTADPVAPARDDRPYIVKTYDRWIILVLVVVGGWFLFRPVMATVCAYRGITYEASLAPDVAEHYYRKATRIDSGVELGWLWLGDLYYNWSQGSPARYQLAAQAYAQGAQDVPASWQLPFDLGRTDYLRLGAPKAAVTALQEAVRRNPKAEFAWDYLGYASLRAGDRAYAISCWRRVLAINPNHTSARDAIRANGGG